MHKRTSPVPAMVGTVLVFLGVGAVGNRWVQEDVVREADQQWFRSLSAPFRWELTPDGRDVDVWVGLNLYPAVWIVATAALLFAVTRRRDRWSFGTLFFSSLGAVTAAAVIAGVLYWAYAEVVLDSFVTRPVPGANLVDGLQFVLSSVVDGPITAGLFVAFAVAVVGALMGSGTSSAFPPPPDSAYAGSPVDPSPPIDATGVMPSVPESPAPDSSGPDSPAPDDPGPDPTLPQPPVQ